ncbi:MAG: aconitate hydratase AcnA, partial [Rhodospirillales bacterium]
AEKFALSKNEAREFEINRERFAFLKACEARFPSLRVIPPGGGIMHQVNLEYLGQVVSPVKTGSTLLAPDTNLGTDSHTTMINGLGVLGWGIGGLEAEGIIFGEATSLNVPRVIGLEITGSLPDEVTATDLALSVAEKLRGVGVVDCFVEVFGPGYSRLSVADRATMANMSPEYGSTCVFCPTDANTIRFLKETGRRPEHVAMVEAYSRSQGLWAGVAENAIDYDAVIQLDLNSIRRSVAGPSRPEQRIDLVSATRELAVAGEGDAARRVPVAGQDYDIGDGDVIIAAITSCTNTANPRNMILAGLMARNAVARGLSVKPHVKTSLSPGSRVVARYLDASGLQDSLDQLGFQVTGFSCSTCNGMSGPLAPATDKTIRQHDIRGVAVLSGNRNFSGRIHPLASRNVLAAPPLVVAYALAGTILKDITSEAVGHDREGKPVMLSDLWPSPEEVDAVMEAHLTAGDFRSVYETVTTVSSHWNALDASTENYDWAPSTYVTFPPFLKGLSVAVTPVRAMKKLRPIAILGDSITTDHISPSGTITVDTEAAKFLMSRGVEPRDFNSFGTRRGSADVVIRSTFAGSRLINEMAPGTEGSWTRLEPEGEVVSVYSAIET